MPDESVIRETIENYWKAFTAGDRDAWVALFTPLRAESRHGPELFLRYCDAAWADCVVSV